MGAQDLRIRVYLNKSRTDKIERDAPVEDWRAFHRLWFPAELTARQLAIAVWKGYSFAPVFNGRKLRENFREAWHIALDFDTEDERSTIDYLIEQPHIYGFASFAYTTPSHTNEAPRARVVWVLPKPIDNYEQYEELYRAMLHQFSWADKSAKDAARFFFGSKGCTVHGNWSVLPPDMCARLTKEYRDSQPDPKTTRDPIVVDSDKANPRLLEAMADGLLRKVRTAPDGTKHFTLNKVAYVFGGYVKSGYYDETEAEQWLKDAVDEMTNVRSKQSAHKTIKDALIAGQSAPLSIEIKQAPRPGDAI